jgi:3-oxoacyl-[acyl-carrier protein] reductase
MGKLNDRVAVITGSARGIGKEIALHLAMEGADIFLDDLRVAEMEATSWEIKDMGRKVLTFAADISTGEGARALIKAALDSFKKVDILVNNAGLPSRSSLLEVIEEEWDGIHRVDLKGVFLCTQSVAKHMMERKYGKIINIASAAGLSGSTGALAYAAAKAGVIQLTKSCAKELGAYGINVNCIAPGRVITDMTRMGRSQQEVESSIASRAAASVLKRVGTPDDIANLAVFLASDDSSFIAGQAIACDGGRMDRM